MMAGLHRLRYSYTVLARADGSRRRVALLGHTMGEPTSHDGKGRKRGEVPSRLDTWTYEYSRLGFLSSCGRLGAHDAAPERRCWQESKLGSVKRLAGFQSNG